MPRGLDHIVHAVSDLDAAAELYRRMGFTVGARNRHPWGTHNYVVQFAGSYLELLTVAEPEKLGSDGFSKLFGAFNRDFLARGEGLSLLIVESKDIAADEKSFRAAGIAASAPMRFEREGKRPDGSTVKVAFTLAFADDKLAPDNRFAACQQHYPENFWNPAFQKHPNGVQGVAGVVLVAEKPAAHRDFLAAYTGGDLRAAGDGFGIDTGRGRLDVLTPAEFAKQFGVASRPASRGMGLAAIRFNVTDTAAMGAALRGANIGHKTVTNRIVIGPDSGMGAVIAFERPGG